MPKLGISERNHSLSAQIINFMVRRYGRFISNMKLSFHLFRLLVYLNACLYPQLVDVPNAQTVHSLVRTKRNNTFVHMKQN